MIQAASLSTAALHVLLSEILFAVATDDDDALGRSTEDDSGDRAITAASALTNQCVAELRHLLGVTVRRNLPCICGSARDLTLAGGGVPLDTGGVAARGRGGSRGDEKTPERNAHAAAAALGRKWGNHALEPMVCHLITIVYVLVTVISHYPLFLALWTLGWWLAEPTGGGAQSQGALLFQLVDRWLIPSLDALLYCFFPNAVAIGLRLAQGRRPLLARFGKRTLYVLDVQARPNRGRALF